MMRYLLLSFFCLMFCTLLKGQDTLLAKPILGLDSKNASFTNMVYQNGYVYFIMSHQDSVANANFKLVKMDTCGNVQKITTFLLDAHFGLCFQERPLTLTKEGNLLFVAGQFQSEHEYNSWQRTYKISTEGKLLFSHVAPKKSVPIGVSKYNPTLCLETPIGIVVGGRYGNELVPLDYLQLINPNTGEIIWNYIYGSFNPYNLTYNQKDSTLSFFCSENYVLIRKDGKILKTSEKF